MPSLLRFSRVLLIGLAVLASALGGGPARAEGADGGGAATGGGAGAGSGSAAGTGAGGGSSGGGASAARGEGGDGSTGSGPSVSAAASIGSAASAASAGQAGSATSKGWAGPAAFTGSAGVGSFFGGLGGFLAGARDSALRAGNEARSELRSEQGLARDAVSRGLVLPLDPILRNVETAVPGAVLSARLKRDDSGVWIYRLVILSPEGRYRNVVVDAARNAILQIR